MRLVRNAKLLAQHRGLVAALRYLWLANLAADVRAL